MKIKLFIGKALRLTLCTIMMLCCVAFNNPINAEGDFKVYDVQTNGSWTDVGSYSDLDSAKTAMKNYRNGIVTNSNVCYSPSNIVAMTNGIAISYTYRKNSGSKNTATAYIYQQSPNQSVYYKSTYVASYNEMEYLDTVYIDGVLMAKVNVTGFVGYIYLQQVDLIPYVYYENDLSITLGGNEYEGTNNVFTSKPKRTVFTVNDKGELGYTAYSYIDSSTKTVNSYVGKKASWMKNGERYYSFDHINYYNDIACTNYVGEFYNYYEFLPLRSYTNLTASDLDSYLETLTTRRDTSITRGKGNLFINAQNAYGINGLLLYAIHALESGWGTSNYAIGRNNLYGWSANDNSPDDAKSFASVEDCINEMAGINLRRYVDTRSANFFGSHLGNKSSGINVKYCSGETWGVQIASIAYAIDKKAGFKDYGCYNLGIVKNDCYGTSFFSDTTKKSVVYTSEYGKNYQKDFTVIIRKQVDSLYEVQSTQPLLNGQNVVTNIDDKSKVAYDFEQSVCYVPVNQIKKIFSNDIEMETSGSINSDYIENGNTFILSKFEFNKDGLSVSGYAYNEGIACSNNDSIIHELILVDTSNNNEIKFTLDNCVYEGSTISGLDCSYAGFNKENIDIYNLDNGEYDVLIRTSYKEYEHSFDSTFVIEETIDVSEFCESISVVCENSKTVIINRIKEKANISTSLRKIEWGKDENEGKLHLLGAAVIKGINLIDKNKIKRNLVVTRISDNKEFVYNLEVLSNEDLGLTSYNILDGTNYFYAWYDTYVDLVGLDYGEYQIYIYVEVEDENGKVFYNTKNISSTLMGNTPETKQFDTNNDSINDKTIFIDKNGKMNSRFEISVKKGLFDNFTAISKPTEKRTSFSLSSISVNDDTTMSVNGFMYICNLDHSSEQMPAYKLLFVNDGVICKEVDLENHTGSYNISKITNVPYDYEYAWYKGTNLDISDLTNGTYDLYISDQCGTYYDFMQMFSTKSDFNKSIDIEDKTYSTIITNNYNRIVLSISDKEVVE